MRGLRLTFPPCQGGTEGGSQPSVTPGTHVQGATDVWSTRIFSSLNPDHRPPPTMPRSPRILQVCNVGQITGGTAACAWTLTRALPEAAHAVLFRSAISAETRQAFAGCTVQSLAELSQTGQAPTSFLRRFQPDLIVLHNTPRGHSPLEKLQLSRLHPRPHVLQYLHSVITPAEADQTVCCSAWLGARYQQSPGSVLLQGVPRPPVSAEKDSRRRSSSSWTPRETVVGRLCTPTARKWPGELIDLYARLASGAPRIHWEFVGCPEQLQKPLRLACRDRARFLPASPAARSHLWKWQAMLYHHPTLTESFGRTVAEAMRCGCIPIVDHLGGFREQITAGTGFLCRNLDSFAAALEAVQSRTTQARLSRGARQHAETHFSIAAFRRRLLALLQSRTGTEKPTTVSD